MCSAREKNINECLEKQVEEIEVLCSIYGHAWKTENEADRSYSMDIKEKDLSLTFYVTLPENYPLECPPIYTILAPDMTKAQKFQLERRLDEVYLENVGQVVLFQWIDTIKEYIFSQKNNENLLEDTFDIETKEIISTSTTESPSTSIEIVHGQHIIDKKSVFQGHATIVFSTTEVKEALDELKKNKKIAKATHNMYAYRICHSENSFIQDCDDDGETNAGGRLLHLLQILNISNVLVVVSRWYGGTLLGPVRFQHINNAARQVLEEAGLLSKSQKKG